MMSFEITQYTRRGIWVNLELAPAIPNYNNVVDDVNMRTLFRAAIA